MICGAKHKRGSVVVEYDKRRQNHDTLLQTKQCLPRRYVREEERWKQEMEVDAMQKDTRYGLSRKTANLLQGSRADCLPVFARVRACSDAQGPRM